jgi:hypothetical protein
MIVTIDGPAGAGKSAVARALATRLPFDYLDSGAMYRVVAVSHARRGVDPAYWFQPGKCSRPVVTGRPGAAAPITAAGERERDGQLSEG